MSNINLAQSNIIALIPLRGGSKGIPDKNIKPISGKILCAWSLEAACSSTNISSVYVSTESNKIINAVNDLNLDVKILNRPIELATDNASTESVMQHFLENVEFDVLVTIQATSPLITSKQLDDAIYKFYELEYDSMLSVVNMHNFIWGSDGKALNYNPKNRPRRQDFKGVFLENGAFYITKREVLAKENCRLGGKIGLFEMPKETIFEIDEPEDFKIVESLLENQSTHENRT